MWISRGSASTSRPAANSRSGRIVLRGRVRGSRLAGVEARQLNGALGHHGGRIVTWRLLQAWVLRLVGAVEMFAFAAVFLPRSGMGAAYAWMGLGGMPEGPVFDSVMRQVSFSYGLHGVALWLIAADVVRYRPLVILTAVGYLLAGPVFIGIDLGNSMPWSWVAANGGSCLLIGALLLALLGGEHRAAKGPATTSRDEWRAHRSPSSMA